MLNPQIKSLKLLLLFIISTYLSINICHANETNNSSQYQVGVLANWGEQQAKERWQPMMDYLSSKIPDSRFSVFAGDFSALNKALVTGKIQFIITNPGQYLYLSNQYPLSWLATMESRRHNGTTRAIGSAILVRADSPYRTIYDLKNRVVAATDPHALGGYKATIELMKKMGMEASTWFRDIQFLGLPLSPLIYQLQSGQVDAAITPVCTLEDMAANKLINATDFRILNPSRPQGFDCQCSTNLYPNWSFAASQSVPTTVTKLVTQALLELKPDSHEARSAQIRSWTSPISQLDVTNLFANFDKAQISTNHWKSVKQWLKDNQYWGLLAVFIFFIATIYHLWIEYKFRQKSDILVETERRLKLKAIALERLQSSAILGEIGAGLAHELNQPIAAITCYSEGGLMRLQNADKNFDEYLLLLEKIQAQSIRAGEIVHRIHGLLKRRKAVLQNVNLLSLMEESLALLQMELEKGKVIVKTQVLGEPFFIKADKVGILQVLVNILKNSLDALKDLPETHSKQITVKFEFTDNQAILEIIDNGLGLSLPENDLMATFFTTKAEGLGLGLAICSDVIKDHKGNFSLFNKPEPNQGCIAQIKLNKHLVSLP